MPDPKKLKYGIYIFLIAILVLNTGMLYQVANIPSDTKPERITELIKEAQNDQIEINKNWAISSLSNFQKYAFSSDQLLNNLKKLAFLIIFSNIFLMGLFSLYFLILLKKNISMRLD